MYFFVVDLIDQKVKNIEFQNNSEYTVVYFQIHTIPRALWTTSTALTCYPYSCTPDQVFIQPLTSSVCACHLPLSLAAEERRGSADDRPQEH